MTVHGACAATSPETLPSRLRLSEFVRAPRTTWSTWFVRAYSRIVAATSVPSRTWKVIRVLAAEGLRPVPQLDEPVEVLVAPLLVERLVERDPVVLEDVQAGDARVGDRLEDPAKGDADRLEEGLGALREVDRDGDHRRAGDLGGRRGAPAARRTSGSRNRRRSAVRQGPAGASRSAP